MVERDLRKVLGLAELHTCLGEEFILNFISVDICAGNFNFAETCATFSTEVVEDHLCFCGARFNHSIMSSLAVTRDFPKSHIRRVLNLVFFHSL